MIKFSNVVIRSFFIQIILLLLMGSIFLFGGTYNNFISSIYGGVVCIVPFLCFTALFFKAKLHLSPQKLLKKFYFAEALKFILTATLFCLVILFFKIEPLPFFISFIVMHLSSWVLSTKFMKINLVKNK